MDQHATQHDNLEERVISFLKQDENYSKFDGVIFNEIVNWAIESVREGKYTIPEPNRGFPEEEEEEFESKSKRIKS